MEADLQQLVDELQIQLERLQHRVSVALDDAQRKDDRPAAFGW